MSRAPASAYALLDFGAGRKLEQFGAVVVDRPCPAAADLPLRLATRWSSAAGRFDTETGWRWRQSPPDDWTFDLASPEARPQVQLELQATSSGQVGVFPEQASNWRRIAATIASRTTVAARMLNLFAYTGASTLAAAAAGAAVTHVDAARGAVAWARRNAMRSGLEAQTIRWIVDDAGEFVARECRRGRTYTGVVLDPPSYGHGPQGRSWQLGRDLPALLAGCFALLADEPASFIALSCHTTGLTPHDLARLLNQAATGRAGEVMADTMTLTTTDGRPLVVGVQAWWRTRAGLSSRPDAVE